MSEIMNNSNTIEHLKDKTIEHENILKEHSELLKEHSKDITDLKTDGREYRVLIGTLCKKMDDFIGTIKWGLGILVTLTIFVLGFLFKIK